MLEGDYIFLKLIADAILFAVLKWPKLQLLLVDFSHLRHSLLIKQGQLVHLYLMSSLYLLNIDIFLQSRANFGFLQNTIRILAIPLQLTFHVSLCTFDVLFDMSYFFFLELVEEDVVFLRNNFDFLLLHFLKPLEFFDFVLGGAKLDVQLLDHSVFLLQQSCVALPFELQPLLQLADLILQLPALLPQLLDLLLQLLHLLPAQL